MEKVVQEKRGDGRRKKKEKEEAVCLSRMRELFSIKFLVSGKIVESRSLLDETARTLIAFPFHFVALFVSFVCDLQSAQDLTKPNTT